MSDFAFRPPPPRDDVLRGLRRRISGLDSSLRILAEEVLGESSIIDLVTVDPKGQVVLLMLGEAGDDLEIFTRALAQRAWVRARIRDWLKLAPGLDLQPDAAVRVVLLCPSFHPETRAAATDIASGVIDLVRYRCLQSEGRTSLLLEPVESTDPVPMPHRDEAPASDPSFRSGLTREDFDLSPEEVRELA